MINRFKHMLFGTDTPTVPQIDAKIEEARAKIAEYATRQREIIDEIAITDGNTAKLTAEHAALAVNIQGMETRLLRLTEERRAARLRELPAEYEATLKGLQADYEALTVAKEVNDKAQAAAREADANEQRIRSRFVMNQAFELSDIATRALESGEFDAATISQIFSELRAKYPGANAVVAKSNRDARMFADTGFGPSLELEPQS